MQDFRDRTCLLRHMRDTLRFYDARVIDPAGGFRQNYFDDGRTFDEARKHLVSSCRLVINYCLGERLLDTSHAREYWQHGLAYVRDVHWQPDRQGYLWSIGEDGNDQTNHCYGLAFVVLMYAMALERGESSAEPDLYTGWSIMEDRFWQPDAGLYADESSADWRHLSNYRGQNCNMHACEAAIFAFEATRDRRFLERAFELAQTIAVGQAGKAGGLVWEHFKPDLSLDWDYNRDDPTNLYRPWGFQPGHQTEWAKLLLLLYRHQPEAWLRDRAVELFDRAVTVAWDDEHGGLFYGFDPDGNICDDTKYFWVQAESFAAAAMLGSVTADDVYWDWYTRLWEYCWTHFVDHEHGAWYRILSADNRKLTDRKSLAGAKCDYHNLGACAIALEYV